MSTRSASVVGARVLALSFAGVLLSELLLNLTQWWFSHSLRSGGGALDHEALFETYRLLSTVGWVAVLGFGAVVALGMWRLAAGVPQPRVVRVAAILQGGAVVAGGVSLGIGLVGAAVPNVIQQGLGYAGSVGSVGGLACLLWGVHAHHRVLQGASAGTALALAAIAFSANWGVLIALRVFGADLPGLVLDAVAPTRVVLSLLANGALFWLFHVYAQIHEGGGAGMASGGRRVSSAASRSLDFFTNTLITRVLILVFGVGLGVVAKATSNVELSKGLAYVLPLISIVLGVLMVVALLELTRRLKSGSSQLAVGLMSSGLLVEAYGLKLVGDVFSGDLHRGLDAIQSLIWVQGLGQVLGLGAMLALISLFGEVAFRSDDLGVRAQIGVLRMLVIGTAVLAVSGRGLAAMRQPPVAVVLTLAVVVLVIALTTLVRFVAMSRKVSALLAVEPEATA
jgi:hypothetical protein